MRESEGKRVLRLARQAVELWVREGRKLKPGKLPGALSEKKGVFVTIHTWPKRELRGCIGYPEPFFALKDGIINAAVHACQDPRFEPLGQGELNTIIIEVSVLTRPKLLRAKEPEEYVGQINVGKDGLIIRRGPYSGLLLPQVAREHGLDTHEFLIETCLKAGLPPAAWMEPGTKIYTFQTEIFSEPEPRGLGKP